MKPWYRRPLVVIAIIVAAIVYIGGNLVLFYRFEIFSSSRSLSPIAKLKKMLSPDRSSAGRPSQQKDKEGKGSERAPSRGFTTGKKIQVTLTSDVRNDIPQAIDVTIDPGLTQGSRTYAILVSAHDRLGINGVTLTIPSYKQMAPVKLNLVKGTAQDGIWKTDITLDYTGQPIQFIIDVENSSARTTTEVTVP